MGQNIHLFGHHFFSLSPEIAELTKLVQSQADVSETGSCKQESSKFHIIMWHLNGTCFESEHPGSIFYHSLS